MKILVTGGSGFIGSHLCDRLIRDGHTVFCLDNFYTGTWDNVQHLLDSKRFQLITKDVVEPFDIVVDQIYNLACPASPCKYQLDPVQTTKTNVYGAVNMLSLAHRTGAKILQASTSEVYGDPEVSPQPESYHGRVNTIGPRACYDEGKRCAETLFFDYHRQYNTCIKVIRIFNTYGPKMYATDGRVISNFILQALKNQDITIYGHGNQTRSFCYVDDLIDGMIALMNTDDHVTGPINVGNPNELSILQLAQVIISLTNSDSQIVFLSSVEDDPQQRKPDITQALNLLNWNPTTDLITGLLKTIEYFKNTV